MVDSAARWVGIDTSSLAILVVAVASLANGSAGQPEEQ
jgi:hypothetical protein